MVLDPVCGMEIDETKAEYHSHYGGKNYVFCSEKCQEEFENHPDEYAITAA